MKNLRRFISLLFLLFSVAGSMSAQTTDTAENTLTLHLKNRPLLDAFSSITEQTDLRFSYNPQLIETNQLISINIKDKNLNEALPLLLPPDITYKRKGKYIILFPQEEIGENLAEDAGNGNKEEEMMLLEEIPPTHSTLQVDNSPAGIAGKSHEKIQDLIQPVEPAKTAREYENINTQRVSLTNINSIDISYKIDNIWIKKSETDDLIIKEYLKQGDQQSYAWIQNIAGNLSIKSGKRNWWLFNNTSLIEIYVPEKYQGKFKISNINGQIQIYQELALPEIDINNVSGAIILKSVTADSIKLNTTSGTIQAGKIKGNAVVNSIAGSIFIDSLSGNRQKITNVSNAIYIGNTVNETINIKNGSGRISVGYVQGNLDVNSLAGAILINDAQAKGEISSTFGPIQTKFTDIRGNLSIKSTSGKISLTIPEAQSFYFSGATKSGSIQAFFLERNNFKSINRQVGIKPEFQLDIQSTSGSIYVQSL